MLRVVCMCLGLISKHSLAITEDENNLSLRDAGSSRERPKLEGFDMDADTAA